MNYIRSSWPSFIKLGPALAVFLILFFGIPRFILVLQANESGGYGAVSWIFVSMTIISIILLNKNGRQLIGVCRPKNSRWILWSFLLGLAFSGIMYMAGSVLYQLSDSNWFVYIGKSYPIPADALQNQKFTLFLIFSLIGMIFSPIGEELLYRGVVHEAFAVKFDDNRSSQLDSLAFALTHLAHFGIVYINDSWSFLPLPAFLWVVLMFVVSRIFFVCRVNTGSIVGAIVGHAGFNLGMTYFIFYHIL